jgi:hypothetical protein
LNNAINCVKTENKQYFFQRKTLYPAQPLQGQSSQTLRVQTQMFILLGKFCQQAETAKCWSDVLLRLPLPTELSINSFKWKYTVIK